MIRTPRTPGRRDLFLSAALLLALGAPLGARAQAPLKIGTIGAGRMGGSLGAQWIKAGHPVMFSSRHPEQLADFVKGLGPLAKAGTPAEAVAFADVVLLAVPYPAEKQIGQEFGPALATKVLVFDVSNPIVPRDGEIGAWAREKGAALATMELMPGIRLVRGFNANNYMRMREQAEKQPGHYGVPLAGDDGKALEVASLLSREAGFTPVVIGGLAMGKDPIPGSPLAGDHTPDEIRQIVAGLK